MSTFISLNYYASAEIPQLNRLNMSHKTVSLFALSRFPPSVTVFVFCFTDYSYKFSSVQSLSRVRLFATLWIVAYHAPSSMDFPGKRNGVGCHFLLQRIFLTQGSNPGLLHCRQTLYRLSHRGSPLVSLRRTQSLIPG